MGISLRDYYTPFPVTLINTLKYASLFTTNLYFVFSIPVLFISKLRRDVAFAVFTHKLH